jgi:hypothetical protein
MLSNRHSSTKPQDLSISTRTGGVTAYSQPPTVSEEAARPAITTSDKFRYRNQRIDDSYSEFSFNIVDKAIKEERRLYRSGRITSIVLASQSQEKWLVRSVTEMHD